MHTIDEATLREWLDRDLEGDLPDRDKALLEESLAERSELRAERRRLARLHALLSESRIEPRRELRAQVMAALPSAAWERRRLGAWALPLALVLLLGAGAALLLAAGGAWWEEAPGAGTAVTLLDFFRVTVLAGAGLLTASWRGLGMALEELFAAEPISIAALGILVLAVNLLFVKLLRRRAPGAAEARTRPNG